MKNIAASALGLVALACVIGYVVLASAGDTVPEALVAAGSAAVGALAGVLVPALSDGD